MNRLIRKLAQCHAGWLGPAAATLWALSAATAPAEVRLHHLFQDHMVLQRGVKCPVYGWAAPGEEIAVAVAGRKGSARAAADGRWRVELEPMPAGGPFELTAKGGNAIVLRDVLVGDVWLCAGQSNMDREMARDGESNDVARAQLPNLRLFRVATAVAYRRREDLQGAWAAAAPASVASFSAVGFYFGRALQPHLGVPVGLIQATEGGTRIQSWMYHETLAADPRFKAFSEDWLKALATYPDYEARFDEYHAQWQKAIADYQAQMARYAEEVKQAEATGKPKPAAPAVPGGPFSRRPNPSILYAGMIAPLTGFPLKGVLWYQGEGNIGSPYRDLLAAMIGEWRAEWHNPDLPFLVVQLPRCGPPPSDPNLPAAWAALREEQMQVARSVPHVGLSVNIDLGASNDIHPRPKAPYGERLALAARGSVYGEKIEYTGPVFRDMAVDGGKARLRFDHIGVGLVTSEGQPVKGFAIAGADGKFVWADAKVEGDAVVVWSGAVAAPKAVRYAWADYPVCNLFSREGLPVAPFRTDVP